MIFKSVIIVIVRQKYYAIHREIKTLRKETIISNNLQARLL